MRCDAARRAMRIGIETSVLRLSRGGSATYTRDLLTHVRALAGAHEFACYAFGRGGPRTLRRRLESVGRDTLWMQLLLPLRLRRERIDVFHATAFSAPLARPCPCVLTVLDLTIVKFPQWFDHPWFHRYAKVMLPLLTRRADRIVTISEHSRRDLVETYALPAEKVRVISPAVDPGRFCPPADDTAVDAVRQRYGLERRYVLSVGTLEPRKNQVRLVEAFAFLRARRGDNLQLVVVGEKGWKFEPVFRAVEALDLDRHVRFLGYVPTTDLPGLYAGAELLAYVSLYEGFGMPVLEAMACGCPVVCSDRASLPEVTGSAAVLVDPTDRGAIADAMEHVLDDPVLAQSLRARGLDRARAFRWDASARALITLYEECAGCLGAR